MNQLHKGIFAFALLALTLAGCGGGGNTANTGNTAGNNPGGTTGSTGGTTGTANAGGVTTFAGEGFPGFWDAVGTAAMFKSPSDVAVDAAGNVFVGDTGNHRIRKITPAGVVSTLAGSGSDRRADGTGKAAAFNVPRGVAVEASATCMWRTVATTGSARSPRPVVVSTLAGSGTSAQRRRHGNGLRRSTSPGRRGGCGGQRLRGGHGQHTIRKITAAGVVSTLAGSGTIGAVDGTGTAATFKSPYGVAVDGAGNVYVADWGNGNIRTITPAGAVSTLAGSGIEGAVDGTGSSCIV